ADRLVRAARVDREGPGVAISAQAAEDRVGEAALFTDVLEQPRAHRAAEQRVQHVARVAVLVILRIAADAETQMALLELLVAHDDLRHDARRLIAHDFAGLGERSQFLLHQTADAIVLPVSERGDDQVVRRVYAPEIAAQEIRIERFDRFLRAENRAPERMVFPEALREDL